MRKTLLRKIRKGAWNLCSVLPFIFIISTLVAPETSSFYLDLPSLSLALLIVSGAVLAFTEVEEG